MVLYFKHISRPCFGFQFASSLAECVRLSRPQTRQKKCSRRCIAVHPSLILLYHACQVRRSYFTSYMKFHNLNSTRISIAWLALNILWEIKHSHPPKVTNEVVVSKNMAISFIGSLKMGGRWHTKLAAAETELVIWTPKSQGIVYDKNGEKVARTVDEHDIPNRTTLDEVWALDIVSVFRTSSLPFGVRVGRYVQATTGYKYRRDIPVAISLLSPRTKSTGYYNVPRRILQSRRGRRVRVAKGSVTAADGG